jgi:hypothetical protein
MNRRRWTYVGIVAGTFGAIAGARYWYRKRRGANESSKQFPGMWDLTKDVAESIESGKRALRDDDEREAPNPPVD